MASYKKLKNKVTFMEDSVVNQFVYIALEKFLQPAKLFLINQVTIIY